MTSQPHIVVIMTCHNRREQTLACLQSVARDMPPGASWSGVLTDDGSTDGTALAVRKNFTNVTVLAGDGDLYWAGGMALAERHALVHLEPDALLWLNDDVAVEPGAIGRLLSGMAELGGNAVLVGSMVSRDGIPTYGGMMRLRGGVMRFRPLGTTATLTACDAFNGNMVLVPARVASRLEGIDQGFRHKYADLDYGLRARAAGIDVYQAGGVLGVCDRDHTPLRLDHLSLVQRLRHLNKVKNQPLKGQLRFHRRHGGRLWPITALGPYVRVLRRRSSVNSGQAGSYGAGLSERRRD